MSNICKIAIIWALIALALNFHTQYEMRGLFFGQDIKVPGATGQMPFELHYFTIVVNILPLLLSLLTMYLSQKWFRWAGFVFAILFALLNAFHVFEQISSHPDDLSQAVLLLFVLAANVLLIKELNDWRKIA
jgi:hypothetical protein